MTARPAPDSRARLAEVIDQNVMGSGIMEDGIRSSWFNDGSDIVLAIETAGFVILDPSSDELVERIADVLVMFVIFGERTHALDIARAIAANLGGGK